MGLFDKMLGDPSSQAMYALGSGLLGVRRGQEGRAFMGAMGAYNDAQQEARRNELVQLQRKQIEAMLEDRKAQMEEAQRKARKQEEAAQYLLQASQPGYAQGATVMKPETMVPQQPQLDPFKLITLFGPEAAQKIMESKNWGRSEVARTIDADEGGQPVTRQFDKFGQPVGGSLPKHVAPVQVNRGSSIDFVKPQAGVSLPMGYSPSDRISLGNLGIARERLAMDKEQNGGGPKPPPGYRWSAAGGSLEAIPGGPADIKATAEGQKADARKKLSGDNAGMVLDTVREAKDLIGYSTSGAGGYLAKLPMTDARTLQGKLLTIKANLGFDRLQAMREASPTGGALGQVAVQELISLQATVASLDQLQKPADLAAALEKIEKHYNNWLDIIDPERVKGGGGAAWSAPKTGDVVDGYRFKGGDPAKKENWERK